MILSIFFLVLIAELFVGGGGRLLEVGPVTVRMLLFAFAVLLMLFPQFWRRITVDVKLAIGLVLMFLAVHLPAVVVGLMQSGDVGAVFGELQPLTYWLMAPFFARMLANGDYVVLTAKVVRAAGLFMAVAYLLLLAGLLLGLVNLLATLNLLAATGEFFFRGAEGIFVYKGFLYLCIALVFLTALPSPGKPVAIVIVGCAIILTLTRGFVLSSVLSIACLLWVSGRRRLVITVALAGLLLGVLIIAGDSWLDGSLFMRKDSGVSNAARLDDISYMFENVDALTFIFGHGFGALISGTRLTIENSYLWIWWKAGLAGVLFWFTPLVLCTLSFKRVATRSKQFPLASAYFFSVVLIYLQTATNPYLTNPIGLSFVLIAIFALRSLVRDQDGDGIVVASTNSDAGPERLSTPGLPSL